MTNDGGSTRTVLGPLATISGSTIYAALSDQKAAPPLSVTPGTSPPALVIMHGNTYTVQNSVVQVAGAPISQGAPATMVDNSKVSLDSDRLVIGSSTVMYNVGSGLTSAIAVTMDGETYTIRNSVVQVAGNTVSEGVPATTIDNTLVSLGSDGLVIGSSTIIYNPVSKPASTAAIVINGESLLVEPSAVVVGSITISQNAPAVTISGTVISLGPTDLVVGSGTLDFSSASSQSTGGVAAAIIQALGRSDTTATQAATSASTTDTNGGGGVGVGAGGGASTASTSDFHRREFEKFPVGSVSTPSRRDGKLYFAPRDGLNFARPGEQGIFQECIKGNNKKRVSNVNSKMGRRS